MREPDPDEKDIKIMDIVRNYYMSLDKLFPLFIDKKELASIQRMVRPYIIDKYYLELEASIV